MPTMREDEYYRMYEVAPQLWWYQSLRNFLRLSLHSFVVKKANLLDAGCGTGENIEYLQKFGFSIQGVDLSETAIRLAKQRKLTAVQVGSVLDLPFKPDTFDAVYSTDVLVMLEKPQAKQASKEFHRVLKKGGVVIVQCAALEYLRSAHDTVVNAKHRYTLRELQETFPPKNWQIIVASYRFFWIFPLIALVKFLKKGQKESSTGDDSDVKPIPSWINSLFYFLQSIEDWLISCLGIRFPWGSSVVIIARKK